MTESFDPRLTGTAGTVRQVADRLVATGHEVRVLTAGTGPAAYHAVGVSRFGPPRRNHKIHESLHAFGPDLVHAFTPGAVGTKALRQAARLGVPTVVTETSARAEFAPPRGRRRSPTAPTGSRSPRPGCATVSTPPGSPRTCGRPASTPRCSPRAPQPGAARHLDRRRPHAGRRRLRRQPPQEARRTPSRRGRARARHPARRGRRRPPAGVATRAPAGSVRFTGELKPRAGRRGHRVARPARAARHPDHLCHALREAAACGFRWSRPAPGARSTWSSTSAPACSTTPPPRSRWPTPWPRSSPTRSRRLLGDHARERISQRTWRDAVDELVREHYAALLGDATPVWPPERSQLTPQPEATRSVWYCADLRTRSVAYLPLAQLPEV